MHMPVHNCHIGPISFAPHCISPCPSPNQSDSHAHDPRAPMEAFQRWVWKEVDQGCRAEWEDHGFCEDHQCLKLGRLRPLCCKGKKEHKKERWFSEEASELHEWAQSISVFEEAHEASAFECHPLVSLPGILHAYIQYTYTCISLSLYIYIHIHFFYNIYTYADYVLYSVGSLVLVVMYYMYTYSWWNIN